MNDEKTNDGVGAYKWVALALLTVGYFMQRSGARLPPTVRCRRWT